jgi:hypothetical protein
LEYIIEMPSVLKVTVIRARNLPIMEKSRNTTDAYCELFLGKKADDSHRTKTIYNNLEP